MEAAIQTAVNGQIRTINAGEVNGRTFLSRSSVGLYPLALWHREQMFRRFGRSRLIALLSGATALLRWSNVMTIRLTIDTENRLFRTRFVFACNNPEELDYFRLHGRQCIEAGNLALYLPKPLSKWGHPAPRAPPACTEKRKRSRDFEMVCARELHLEIDPSRVPVSRDGEVEIMETPLHYRLVVGALRVRVPLGTVVRRE